MSLNTQTSVSIGGHQFQYFHSLKLEQSVDGHHTFEILISYDWLAKLGKGIFASSREFLGKEVRIVIQAVEHTAGFKETTFSGLVTAVNAGKEGDGTHGYCIVKGSSPTVLLDNEPHMQTYEQQSLSDIVNACLKNCLAYTSRPAVSPKYSDTLKYTVQYRESNYTFLRRMAARYGEWFFYDGQQIIFGNYSPRKINLIHQVDLIDFDLQLQVLANNTKYSNYEYRKDTDVTQDPGSSGGSGNVYADHAGTVSNRLFNKPSLNRLSQAVNSSAKEQLESFSTLKEKSRNAQMVTLSGHSRNTGLRIGDTVSVKESMFSTEDHGEFMLTKITHFCTGNGEYTNSFEGIPADVAIPVVDLDSYPLCEPQSALVTDNNDPKGLGRVRARLRWQSQGSTPWIRLVSPHGGGDKGFYFIPEVGEEVMVDFEGGNPELPFVLGTTYSGNSRTTFGDVANNLKVIKTRSGHTIQMDDTTGEEKITITDISGNVITLDTRKGNIRVSAPQTLTFEAKNIVMTAQESIAVGAGESINTSAGDNISAHASKDFLITSSNFSNIVENKSTLVANEIEKTAQRVRIDSTAQNMELVSSRKIDIQSAEKIRLF